MLCSLLFSTAIQFCKSPPQVPNSLPLALPGNVPVLLNAPPGSCCHQLQQKTQDEVGRGSTWANAVPRVACSQITGMGYQKTELCICQRQEASQNDELSRSPENLNRKEANLEDLRR